MSTELQTEKKNQKLSFQQVYELCALVKTVHAGGYKNWPAVLADLSARLGFPVSQSSVQNAMAAVGRDSRELIATTESMMALYEIRVRTLEERVVSLGETVETLGRLLERSVELLSRDPAPAVPPASGPPLEFVASGASVVAGPATATAAGDERVGGVSIDSPDLDVD